MNSGSASETECHVLRDLVTVEVEDVAAASAQLGSDPLDPGSLNDILGGDLDGGALERLVNLIGVFSIGEDPHEVAAQLRDNDITASPVHAVGTMNHIRLMTGAPARRATVTAEPELDEIEPTQFIGVIDSGVTSARYRPDWLSNGLMARPEDVEPPNFPPETDPPWASHGSFTAGLIREIAPKHTIALARARPRPIGRFSASMQPSHEPGDDPTTELDVLEATIRLVDRLRSADGEVTALNMSLGAHACDKKDPMLVALKAAVRLWRDNFPEAPIFAAGGNTESKRKVFPAAYKKVRGVSAAADGSGDQVVWDRAHSPIAASKRRWITDVAPGVDLIGTSGMTGGWVTWSGSSFATAVACALYANGVTPERDGRLRYWPDRTVTYSAVDGLRF
jgi:hypothetical protein